jgi:hypothetical protein
VERTRGKDKTWRGVVASLNEEVRGARSRAERESERVRAEGKGSERRKERDSGV